MEIVSGLNSSSVFRLKQTWAVCFSFSFLYFINITHLSRMNKKIINFNHETINEKKKYSI